MPTPIKAILFDIDGTLVDSNYLHVDAWQRALAGAGHAVDAWKIHRAIGKDSDELLKVLVGDAAESIADAASDAHSELYAAMADRLRPFDGARELIAELADRGVRVVLATSAPEDELATLRTVLDVDGYLTGVTSSGDVETAKPEPDIVQVALERAGVGADEAVFVGDTIWDIQAAGKAGVPTIGVRSGGVSEEELRGAGAVEVYDDVRDLLDHLDDSDALGL
ncbi:HAD family hydrolase [Naasia lichenicola]|uniref:HAD family hydrolase n=1 Tax=Naasia lichenicola TaxID=2565933 RepID=A0A4S4FEL6_9MICO|nr:HAD family hydrolase [Naasia lichenicola]THG28599.1 HAD family hydrolase [Naasia lichenicola]